MITQKENELWFKVLKYIATQGTTEPYVVNEFLNKEAQNIDILTIKRSFDYLVNEGLILRHNSFASINSRSTLANTQISAKITLKGLQLIETTETQNNITNKIVYNVSGNMALGNGINQSITHNTSTENNPTTESKLFSVKSIVKYIGGIVAAVIGAYLITKFGFK